MVTNSSRNLNFREQIKGPNVYYSLEGSFGGKGPVDMFWGFVFSPCSQCVLTGSPMFPNGVLNYYVLKVLICVPYSVPNSTILYPISFV